MVVHGLMEGVIPFLDIEARYDKTGGGKVSTLRA
jgi:hypothetical protein